MHHMVDLAPKATGLIEIAHLNGKTNVHIQCLTGFFKWWRTLHARHKHAT